MKKFLFAALILSAPLSLQAQEPELKGTPSSLTNYLTTLPKTVYLTGTGEAKAVAGEAEVSLVVKTEESSLQESLEANAAIRRRVKEAMAGKGIKPESIKESKFSTTPEYGWLKEKPKSYTVTNTLTFTVKTDAQLSSVAGVVDGEKDVFYRGISFPVSDDAALKKEAVNKALEDVTAQKTLYEKTLDLKLIPVAFRANAGQPVQRGQELLTQQAYGGVKKMSFQANVERAQFGEFGTRADVTVEFQVVR